MSIHPLGDETEHSHRAHEEDSIVKLWKSLGTGLRNLTEQQGIRAYLDIQLSAIQLVPHRRYAPP